MCTIQIFYDAGLLGCVTRSAGNMKGDYKTECNLKVTTFKNKRNVGVIIISSPYTEAVADFCIRILARIEARSKPLKQVYEEYTQEIQADRYKLYPFGNSINNI